MSKILYWYHSRNLTFDNVKTAWFFYKDPESYRPILQPYLWDVLDLVISQNAQVMELERQRGWPARSAKVVVRTALEVAAGPPPPPSVVKTMPLSDAHKRIEELEEQIEYLTGTNGDQHIEFMFQYGMTQIESQMFSILMNFKGRVVTKSAIFDRVYGARPDQDWPDPKVVDVLMCKIRKHLKRASSPYTIDTVWGTGYRLVQETEDAVHAR